jgi:hypothetical protein
MSRTSRLQAVAYEAESNYAEAVSTFGTRLAVYDNIDTSGLDKAKMESPRIGQYRSERGKPIPLVKGGSFRIRMPLAGHGSSTAGAGLSVAAYETLLGYVIGTAELSASGGTTVASAADADSITTAASGTFDAQGFAFIGVKGDLRGDGQPVAIDTHVATAMELLTAAPAAPTNGDVVAACTQVYPDDQPTATLTSLRFRLSTANQCYDCHGCVPTSVEYETARGRPLTIAITFQVGYWLESTPTFPTSASFDEFVPAPYAGGSFFFQAHGTTTRATYLVRDLRIEHTLGTKVMEGPQGLRDDQLAIGAIRTGDEMFRLSFTLDAQTQSASPTWPANWDAEQDFHVLVGFNGAASGKRVGLYLRRFRIDGKRPVQQDFEGVNSYAISGFATTDTGGASARALAPYVWLLG